MATTPTTPPAGGAPASAPKKNNDFDDLSAGAAWLAIFVYRAHLMSGIKTAWAATKGWLRDYSFERAHLWVSWVRIAALMGMVMIPAILFGIVPWAQATEHLLTVAGVCEGVLLLVALRTWVPLWRSQQVREATTEDLRDFRTAAEEAEANFAAVKKADPYRSTPAVYDAAEREALAARADYKRFLEYVGPSNRSALLLGFITWSTLVVFGFVLVGAAMELHMGPAHIRQSQLERVLFGGSLVYFLVGVFPTVILMYVVSIAGSAVVKAEKALHMARQGAQGVLTPGGVTGDTIDARERAEQAANGDEPGRMATDIFVYRIWQSCVSLLVASFGQVLLIWQWTNHEVSIRSAKYSFVVTCIELLIYWGRKDPTLHRKKEPTWVGVMSFASLLVVVHFLFMGNVTKVVDGELVYGPASAWLDHGPLFWLTDNSGYMATLFSNSLVWIDFDGPQVVEAIIIGVILIGVPTALVIWLAKKTTPDKAADVSPLLKSGRNFALAAIAAMTILPACIVTVKQLAPSARNRGGATAEQQHIANEAGRFVRASDESVALDVRDSANAIEQRNARRGGVTSSSDYNERCHVDPVSGQVDCTAECFQQHNPPYASTQADLEVGRREGFCRPVAR